MNKKAIQLPVQTITLVIGFMVWVILSGLIPYIKEDIVLTANQLTLVTDLLIGGLFIGISGAIFSAGVTALPKYYPKERHEFVNGIVSAMGGLGGFFPPIILSFLFNLTGHYAIGYMALSEVALACLIIVVGMFYQERLNQANRFNESFEPSSKKLKHG